MASSYVKQRFPMGSWYEQQAWVYTPEPYRFIDPPFWSYVVRAFNSVGTREYLYSWRGFYPLPSPRVEHIKHVAYQLDPSCCNWAMDLSNLIHRDTDRLVGRAGDGIASSFTLAALMDTYQYSFPIIPASDGSVNAALYDAMQYFKNGCIDKQLDGAVTVTESPGFLDYAKQMADWNTGTIKKIASSRLFYAFGLKTLAQDLVGIAVAIDSLPKHLEWLASRNGKATDVSFRKRLKPAGSPYTLGTLYHSPSYAYKFTDWRGDLCVKGKVIYNLDKTAIKGASYEIEAWKQALGLKNPLTFVWEKIPFSWIIDYFTGLGDLFSRIGEYPMFEDVQFHEGTYSIKIKQSSEFLQRFNNRLQSNMTMRWGRVDTEYYKRMSPVPNVDVLETIEFGLPGFWQKLNLVALATTFKFK